MPKVDTGRKSNQKATSSQETPTLRSIKRSRQKTAGGSPNALMPFSSLGFLFLIVKAFGLRGETAQSLWPA